MCRSRVRRWAGPCSCGQDSVGGAIKLEGGAIGFDGSGPAACAAAGGQCLPFGSGPCTLVGPPGACNPDQPGPGGSFCCAVGPAGGTCSDVKASDYDQSCQVDGDCVGISTRSCFLCAFNCPNAAINAGALAQYTSDVASSTAMLSGQRLACSGDCPIDLPSCVSGRCQWGPPYPLKDAAVPPCPARPICIIVRDAAADTGAHAVAIDTGPSDATDVSAE